MSDNGPPAPGGEFLVYRPEEGLTRVECRFADESLWLSQAGMVELFQTSKQNIAKHLKAIFAESELAEHSVVNSWLTTAADGKRGRVMYYSLAAILAVGCRVQSLRGTQFRRWATDSIDYDPNTEASQQFFAIIQNKMHWAAHGHTAAEVILQRADASQPNMGLTSFSGTHPGRSEVGIARNYLNAEAEYQNYRRQLDALPAPVERDMASALDAAVKQLPRSGRKRK